MPARHDPAVRLGQLSPALRERLLRTAPPGLTREALVRDYLDGELGIAAVARKTGCRAATVLFHLALNGIPLRGSQRGR